MALNLIESKGRALLLSISCFFDVLKSPLHCDKDNQSVAFVKIEEAAVFF